MHISTEAIVAIVSLVVAAPCTAILVWKVIWRRQDESQLCDGRGAAQANQLSLRHPGNGGYAIRAQVEITLEAGLQGPQQFRIQSRAGHLAALPL